MKEFDYDLDYKSLDFTDAETRKLYRIGRGEQGVLLVRPYTNDICAHWRFVDEEASLKSSDEYTRCSVSINDGKISLEWTWQGNSLRWDSLVPDGMPITLRDGNMQAMGVYLPAKKIGKLTNVKARSAKIVQKSKMIKNGGQIRS